ncbi:hypothetical protein GH714_003325 [Hevea brasiliensis]|uniref:Cysteine proteinase n=1 Tax=Hevea brasiliensis TaxID=3981 RepID=A0A6A6LXJ9_HEVBR|nr:hypothetical protein GH714_003325 [Hevea brasiliensis]
MAAILENKQIFVVVLVMGILASQAWSRSLKDATMTEKHEMWMAKYGRVYKDNAEKERRFNIFKENAEFIESCNNAGNKPYKLDINEFADLTNEEFRASRNGYKRSYIPKSSEASSFKYENVTAVPTSIDWRKKGAVTPIKDQGQCGCCWAFSAVAAMEGITKLSTGKLISLSEQELVDCDTSGEDQGCEGGLMDDAFEFIIQNGGLTTEANYPYKGEDGDCGTELDHGVTAVGYGTSDDGTKYWVGLGAKNLSSLGTSTFQHSTSAGGSHPSTEAMSPSQRLPRPAPLGLTKKLTLKGQQYTQAATTVHKMHNRRIKTVKLTGSEKFVRLELIPMAVHMKLS